MPDEVHSGGDYGGNPRLEERVSAIEARLDRLEAAVDEIRAELKAMRADMTAIRLELAEVKGRLANIPTSFQIAFMLVTFTVATFIGATGLALAILRLGGAH
jgi:outer membrane murein-binding lipoprotein Lpp